MSWTLAIFGGGNLNVPDCVPAPVPENVGSKSGILILSAVSSNFINYNYSKSVAGTGTQSGTFKLPPPKMAKVEMRKL